MFKLAENLKKKRKGYTLVELVIVIIVISILAGVFFAMGSDAPDTARISLMKTNMTSIRTALLSYSALKKDGQLPATLDELLTGIAKEDAVDGREHKNLISGEDEDFSLVDPWGEPYVYDRAAKTLSCTPKTSNGESLDTHTIKL